MRCPIGNCGGDPAKHEGSCRAWATPCELELDDATREIRDLELKLQGARAAYALCLTSVSEIGVALGCGPNRTPGEVIRTAKGLARTCDDALDNIERLLAVVESHEIDQRKAWLALRYTLAELQRCSVAPGWLRRKLGELGLGRDQVEDLMGGTP